MKELMAKGDTSQKIKSKFVEPKILASIYADRNACVGLPVQKQICGQLGTQYFVSQMRAQQFELLRNSHLCDF